MIELINVTKEYENAVPFRNLSLKIEDGEVISIIGPSGTGKSTLMRVICMLTPPTSGRIFIDGNEITAKGANLSIFRRKMGMVFQGFNLFPHLTAIENIMAAPMHILGMSRSEAYRLGMEKLSEVGLEGCATQYPSQLSGGQKQRAAIARTLVMNPKVIFFDEPTSALDPTMVGEVQAIIRRIARDGRTVMIVTHDMSFAKEIATRVLYMDQSCVYEDGTPEQIFDNPQRERTRDFIKKQRTLCYDVIPGASDSVKAIADIGTFCVKNNIPSSIAIGAAAIFEELCLQLLDSRRRHSEIILHSDTMTVSMDCDYDGAALNDDAMNSVSGKLIAYYAENIRREQTNDKELPNRISMDVRAR